MLAVLCPSFFEQHNDEGSFEFDVPRQGYFGGRGCLMLAITEDHGRWPGCLSSPLAMQAMLLHAQALGQFLTQMCVEGEVLWLHTNMCQHAACRLDFRCCSGN